MGVDFQQRMGLEAADSGQDDCIKVGRSVSLCVGLQMQERKVLFKFVVELWYIGTCSIPTCLVAINDIHSTRFRSMNSSARRLLTFSPAAVSLRHRSVETNRPPRLLDAHRFLVSNVFRELRPKSEVRTLGFIAVVQVCRSVLAVDTTCTYRIL